MSSLKSAIAIVEEANTVTVEIGKPARPVLVTKTVNRNEDYVTRRVEAALDADFANGNMPA